MKNPEYEHAINLFMAKVFAAVEQLRVELSDIADKGVPDALPSDRPRLRPELRKPGSSREALRKVLRSAPSGLFSSEVIARLPDHKESTVRANLSVLVRTFEVRRLPNGRYVWMGV
jgi:hypothetical protein